jgi:sugar lactone lactonase YvrE
MTEQSELDTVCEVRNILGEGPIWEPRTGHLYWTDIEASRYHRLELKTGKHETFETGTKVGAIALREGEGLLLATKEGFAFHRPEAGAELTFIGNPEPSDETRFNDGAVGPDGRYWAGSYGRDENTLYRLDPDGSIHPKDSGFGVPNGIAWSLDGKTMYFTDSSAKTIYAYDYDLSTGDIDNRRPFVHKPDEEGVPDGMIVDAEGYLWSAWWGGWKLERYDPEGKLERTIKLPMKQPTSLAFGGEGLDELYVTSASTGLSEDELAAQPQAGRLVRFYPGVKGGEEHRFKDYIA